MLATLSFTACDSDEQKMTDDDAMLINMAPATSGASTAGSGGSLTPITTPSGTQQPVTAPATQAGKTAAALNPEHGQPNHRCDIPVGAPLDSPAPQPAATTSPAANAAPAVQAQPASTESGANPPHGQPGHRCDIPVGAPLSSAPATK